MVTPRRLRSWMRSRQRVWKDWSPTASTSSTSSTSAFTLMAVAKASRTYIPEE